MLLTTPLTAPFTATLPPPLPPPLPPQCFTEQCWASLTKDYDFSLDLGRLAAAPAKESKREIIEACTRAGGRRPPLLPQQFSDALATRSFTNGTDDLPLVVQVRSLT
jgi:hypothetical protein